MGTFPSTRLGKIEFYESHLPAWAANAAAIGITPTSVSDLTALTVAARTAYDAHIAAQNAARAATANYHELVSVMHSGPGAGSDMIKTIRAFAQSTDNPNVYVLAQIPPPATPGVTPPPGTPFDFKVELLQNGALDLRWKCKNPAGVGGTMYEVLRQVSGGSFSFVGAPGEKSFVDDTVPSGVSPVTYQITAVRSTARGNPAQFIVNFGAGGQTIASVTTMDSASMKMAA